MLKKNTKMFYLLVVVLLFTSSIGYAESFNFENINYKVVQYNRYTPSYNYSYNYNYSYPKYNVVVNGYNYNWGNVITIPVNPSKPVVPSTPSVPTKPSVPTVPSTPTVPTVPSVPTQPTTPTLPNSSLSAMEQEVVRLTNIERVKAGLNPFTVSTELSKVARLKSEDMGKNNYFSHTSLTYGSPFDMMKQFGIKYSTAGENIARGYLSAASVVNGWMNSSGHRANILNPSFNTIGVGAYTTSNNTTYWTQQFTN